MSGRDKGNREAIFLAVGCGPPAGSPGKIDEAIFLAVGCGPPAGSPGIKIPGYTNEVLRTVQNRRADWSGGRGDRRPMCLRTGIQTAIVPTPATDGEASPISPVGTSRRSGAEPSSLRGRLTSPLPA